MDEKRVLDLENEIETNNKNSADFEEKVSSQDESDILKAQLEKLSQEKEEFYQNYLRVLADQENLKRRTAKEKEEALKFALENFFKDLLPVLDSLDQAMLEAQKEEEKTSKSLQEGMNLISKKLLQTLEKNGLETIPSKGEAYNPNLHQAIQTEKSSEVDSAIVKEEFMRGYQLNGRLLRASMVCVLLPDENKKPLT